MHSYDSYGLRCPWRQLALVERESYVKLMVVSIQYHQLGEFRVCRRGIGMRP